MTLHVDDVAEETLARLVGALRSARLDTGLTQNALSSALPVRGRAISEWENGTIRPTLENLMQCSRRLGRSLEIVDPDGKVLHGAPLRQPGEAWKSFERRRLAWPLRSRRVALGMSQRELGRLIGVSRDSIQRWELAHVPPRPISLIVWARQLECSVVLLPKSNIRGEESVSRVS